MKLISENAPKAVKEQQMENYFARKVAVDASMSLYQFLVRHTQRDTATAAALPLQR
jgi:flap endonuclease-1